MVDPESKTRLRTVWVVLLVITAAYLALDAAVDEGSVLAASTVVTTSAIVIALVKVRIILREFMEVRSAPVLLGRLTDLCIGLMALALLGSYAIGQAVH